jgi:hypothetical protein
VYLSTRAVTFTPNQHSDMRRRWCAAALLDAEKKFRRLKGYRHMPQLIRVLDRLADKHSGAAKIA